MLELMATMKCDCGQRLRVVLTKRNEPTNPMGLTLEDIMGDPLSTLIITDGKLELIKDGPVIVYKFVCNECLKK